MSSHTLLNLGLFLVFTGAAGLYMDYWRRMADCTEREANRVRDEFERKHQELARRQIEERMEYDKRDE